MVGRHLIIVVGADLAVHVAPGGAPVLARLAVNHNSSASTQDQMS